MMMTERTDENKDRNVSHGGNKTIKYIDETREEE